MRYITPNTILDIGCGNGHTLKFFRSKYQYAELFGVDISPEAVRLAKEKTNAHVVCYKFEEVSLPYCDLVLCMGVGEHFLFLREFLIKLAQSGKYVYLEVPNCLSYSNVKEEGFRETTKGAGQAEWHLYRKSWEKYIKEAGFEILESIKGPNAYTEFIWMLKSPEMLTGHPVMDKI